MKSREQHTQDLIDEVERMVDENMETILINNQILESVNKWVSETRPEARIDYFEFYKEQK